MTRHHCPTCDRREATDDEWRDVPEGARPDLCWSDPGCRANAVNWRERALAAEAEVERVRDRLAEARDDMLAARSELCALLDGHLSPSDAVRLDAITRATAARRGWGM